MKTWLRWTLIITQVGGGFFGSVTALEYLLRSENVPPLILLISLGFATLYAFVIVAGVLFALDKRRTLPLRVALWLQVPRISSPFITWWFSAGLCLNLTFIGEQLGFEYWLGSFWQLNLFTDLSWGVGINLFALLLLILLGRQKNPQANLNKAIAEPVDPILQMSLENLSQADHAVRLKSSLENSRSVVVGLNQYASMYAARQEEIKLLVQSASRHGETGSQQGTVLNSDDGYLDRGISSMESSSDGNEWRYA